MPDASADPHVARRFFGAELMTLGGLAAAFGLASCCALPLLPATLGLSTAWLTGVAALAAPRRGVLIVIAGACLVGAAALLLRRRGAAATCEPRGGRAARRLRVLTLVGLLIGGGLLWAGYAYA
jgi:mercuric ion transport protein